MNLIFLVSLIKAQAYLIFASKCMSYQKKYFVEIHIASTYTFHKTDILLNF